MSSEEFAGSLSKPERDLRQKFVKQYIVDFNAVNACIRLGYQPAFAKQYAEKFLDEQYTLKLIEEKRSELGLDKDDEEHRRRVLGILYGVAYDQHRSGSAIVAAASAIAKITGIEAPVKTQQEVHLTADSPTLGHLTVQEMEEIKKKLYAPTAE